ncbi:MAG: GNAT family N-acetyltransferase [Paracoccaceae bacterium]|jgi:RimJ/RimL family protein N-acetyltransferase
MVNLRLRDFREDDFDAFHALCSDYDVVKMVCSWPYPADSEFSRMRMNTPEAKAGLVSVIECGGKFAGSIGGIQGGLGYMLAKRFWGCGIATWAVRAKVNECFRRIDWDKIEAGAWVDHPASIRVLEKCGFKFVNEITQFCKARDCEVDGVDFVLTRKDLAKSNLGEELGLRMSDL